MSMHNKVTATKIRAGLYDLDGYRRFRAQKTGKFWELFQVEQGELRRHLGAYPTFAAARAEAEVVDEQLGSQMVVRKNLMSGQPFEERADTPVYLSPARETYWSM